MEKQSDEYWFVLSIFVGALIAMFYDIHQYWLGLFVPNVVFVKTFAGILSAFTALGYYWLFRSRKKKKPSTEN